MNLNPTLISKYRNNQKASAISLSQESIDRGDNLSTKGSKSVNRHVYYIHPSLAGWEIWEDICTKSIAIIIQANSTFKHRENTIRYQNINLEMLMKKIAQIIKLSFELHYSNINFSTYKQFLIIVSPIYKSML